MITVESTNTHSNRIISVETEKNTNDLGFDTKLYISQVFFKSPHDFFQTYNFLLSVFFRVKGSIDDFIEQICNDPLNVSVQQKIKFSIAKTQDYETKDFFALYIHQLLVADSVFFDGYLYIEDDTTNDSFSIEGFIEHNGGKIFLCQQRLYIESSQKEQICIFLA